MKTLSILVLFAVISASSGCSWLKKQWQIEKTATVQDIQTAQKDASKEASTIIMTPVFPPPSVEIEVPKDNVSNT